MDLRSPVQISEKLLKHDAMYIEDVELHLKLTQVLHLEVTHLESQNMAHLAFGFLVLISFLSFVELCLKR